MIRLSFTKNGLYYCHLFVEYRPRKMHFLMQRDFSERHAAGCEGKKCWDGSVD